MSEGIAMVLSVQPLRFVVELLAVQRERRNFDALRVVEDPTYERALAECAWLCREQARSYSWRVTNDEFCWRLCKARKAPV